MTIAKRLLLLIATLLGSLALVGLLSVTQMRSQSESINSINTNVVPSLVVIDKVERDFSMLRNTVLRHVISTDEKEMARLEEDIGRERQSIDADLKIYQDQLITDDRDRELLLADQSRMAAYYTLIEQVLPLSRSLRTAEVSERLQAGRATIDAGKDALRTHAEYNLKLTNDEGAAIETRSRQGAWIVAGVLALALGAGSLLGFSTYRRIVGSLDDMKTVMGDIACDLDFTRRAPARGNDEIAATSKAFNALIDKVQGSMKACGTMPKTSVPHRLNCPPPPARFRTDRRRRAKHPPAWLRRSRY